VRDWKGLLADNAVEQIREHVHEFVSTMRK